MTGILVPVAPGELIDRLTILQIKLERIADPAGRANVAYEHALLTEVADRTIPPAEGLAPLRDELAAINAALWDIEDGIRACDAGGDFGAKFVALAQSVYRTNDRRAAVKRRINLLLGSAILEVKSYHDHPGRTE